MLISTLLPLLTRYSLAFDLVAGPDDTVTLTIVPRKVEGATHKPESGEIRPIAITAPAAEIDAELTKGAAGALGELITARKTLADQLAEQREAAEAARVAAAAAAKAKSAAPAPRASSTANAAAPLAASGPPAAAKAEEPASLWD